MLLTRLVSLLMAMVLVASPAAAQRQAKADFVGGFKQLDEAMLAGDAARANAAIVRMAAALIVWGVGADPVSDVALLDEEDSAVPALPLSAYADGFSHLRRREYVAAVAAFRRAVATANSEWSQLSAAGTMAQQGRELEAAEALRAIVEAFPSSGVAHWWLARVSERLNRTTEARREYEVAAAMALSGRAPLYAAIGRLSRIEGDFARAAEAYEQRLLLTPGDPRAHKDLARIHLEQGRPQQALAAFSAAVALNARDAEAHAEIGRIHLDTGLPAEAIASLRRALDLVPAMFEARYPLAHALKQMGRSDEAARELELFERGRRAAAEDRRRTMAAEVNEEAARQGR